MTITVDIADRLYDYTDEEKAADAIEAYQAQARLSDQEILEIWSAIDDPRRADIERQIYEAVDANGSAKRAEEAIPGGISLMIDESV